MPCHFVGKTQMVEPASLFPQFFKVATAFWCIYSYLSLKNVMEPQFLLEYHLKLLLPL